MIDPDVPTGTNLSCVVCSGSISYFTLTLICTEAELGVKKLVGFNTQHKTYGKPRYTALPQKLRVWTAEGSV